MLLFLLDEKKCTIYNRGPSLEEDGKVTHQTMITLDTMIKIVRQKSVRYVERVKKRAMIISLFFFRLTSDGSEYSLYFNTGNTRIYKEKDPQVIVLEEEVITPPLVVFILLSFLSFRMQWQYSS